jgi:hypothetical protein
MSSHEDKLAPLESMSQAELREAWERHFRTAAPPSMSRELLRQAVGYKMQEQEAGGLGRRLALLIKGLEGRKIAPTGSARSLSAPLLRPGAKLLREWQGKVHEALALEDGQFAYGGRTYRSLSEIAKAITGAHWSGPRFFGFACPPQTPRPW